MESPSNPPASSAGYSGSNPATADATAAITRKLTEGNEMAYREFHHAYAGRLARYLLVVSRGDETAMRDALQETFRRVVRHVREFPSEEIFWSWLTVLARSALADQRRTRRRYLAFLDRFTSHHTVAHEAALNDSRQATLHEPLQHSLNALPAEERALIEGKYFEHHSVAELAAQLNVSEKAVESRLTRIRQKLKAALLADQKNNDPAR